MKCCVHTCPRNQLDHECELSNLPAEDKCHMAVTRCAHRKFILRENVDPVH